ncbi:MAG: hypothetical protein ICV75_04285 [Nitrospiraceae bacterium]|nr:hypothetical protein [Nitrospiraceae bacterium]
MICTKLHTHPWVLIGALTGLLFGLAATEHATAATAKKSSKSPATPAAVDVARRYAEAVSKGDRLTVGQLDFGCQYRLVTASPRGRAAYPPASDPSYDACWQQLTAAHASATTRTDLGMEVLWPSTGPLVFYGDDLPRFPATAFVMDALGVSPPGTGLRLTVARHQTIPAGSFRLKSDGPVIGVPTTLVQLTVHYQDPLTSPVTYAAGTVKWANTIKRARRAVKSVTTQWVVFTGLKKHGFPGDAAVFVLPIATKPDAQGMVAEKIPFTTELSRALPDTLVWWGPEDQPGTLTAAAARAATFPELRDRVALLNRVLIIDPNQVDALMVLTRNLYAMLLREAANEHKLTVKDPALSLVVNEFYWNIYAGAARLDLSNGMEMGGFSQPTPADFLYRILPALETLTRTHPEQLDSRFRLGVAYRWNNDQRPMIETFEALLKDIPDSRKTPKAEALLQLAWSRINKVAWNRILHDPESLRAYADAEASLAYAELPLDKFLAEYTMAYSMIFMPDYGDKAKMLHHLTEAKQWFDEVPGKHDDVWRYFLHTELLKAVLDADPTFQPILASAESKA